MLDKWLKKEERPSWDQIVAALENMSEKSLASELKKKYLQQPEIASAKPTPLVPETVLKVHRRDSVARELERLKETHLRLRDSAESALEDVNPSSRQLKRFSQSYCNRVVTTVEELFDCLDDFCFLDYALLQYIINYFLNEAQSVVTSLGNYIQQLTNFKSSTSLKEFMESIQNAQKSKQGIDVCTVTLRLVGGWIEKTMKDLDRLLKEIFQDKSSILTHLKIIRGSVIVTYLAPRSGAHSLISLAQTKLSFMQQVGVCTLSVGDTVCAQLNQAENFMLEISLFEAVVRNDIDLVAFLLNINTSPDAATDKDEGNTALVYGSYFNREEAVRLLLKANANPNYQGKNGCSPLYMAAQNGHSSIVRLILQTTVNVNLQTDDGSTPLFIASQMGHAEIVAILLEANASPNIQRIKGFTPLHIAAQEGHSDIVDMLLQANVDPDHHSGMTPLCIAAQQGHSDTVAILLKGKADPNLQSDAGITPLFIASQEGYSYMVHILLGANANPNIQTSDNQLTPLFQAAQQGHTDTVSILLRANANPNLRSADSVTPLYIAAEKGHYNIVKLLLRANANSSLERVDGTTPLFIAAQIGYSDIVSILLQGKSDPNQRSGINGMTPLHIATQERHYDIVRMFLKANANPKIQGDDGVTPLYIACQLGYADIVQLLLEAKADPDLSLESGATPVMCASLIGFPQIVQLLLKHGADPNKTANIQLFSTTALMCASDAGCLKSTKLLLHFGADPTMISSEGQSALDIAVSSGHNEIAEIIKAQLFSKSSTTSPVLKVTEVSNNTNKSTVRNNAMNSMLPKAESCITTYYKNLQKILISESFQEMKSNCTAVLAVL